MTCVCLAASSADHSVPAAAAAAPTQLRLRPQFHFPVTLGFDEVSDILIPEKSDKGAETDFFKNSFASTGSRKVYERFMAKLRQYKFQAAGGTGSTAAAAAAAVAGGAGDAAAGDGGAK